MDDNKEVSVSFFEEEGNTRLQVIFDSESENSPELQSQGWQTILDQYKKYIEAI